MESIVAVFQDILSDSNTIFMGLLIFLAVGTFAFSLMQPCACAVPSRSAPRAS
jgi:hypothetical protein